MIRLERVKVKLSDIKKQRFTETQIASILKQYDGDRGHPNCAASTAYAKPRCTIGERNMQAWIPVISKR